MFRFINNYIVLSIKVSVRRDGLLNGKLNRKFEFNLNSSQELICL